MFVDTSLQDEAAGVYKKLVFTPDGHWVQAVEHGQPVEFGLLLRGLPDVCIVSRHGSQGVCQWSQLVSEVR